MEVVITGAIPVLPAANTAESLKWWTEVCGFQETFRDSTPPNYAGINRGDAYLHIVVELLPGVKPDETMAPLIAASIRAQLLRLNSEFANYTPAERQLPRITLRSFADPEYFPAGVKHRYTRN